MSQQTFFLSSEVRRRWKIATLSQLQSGGIISTERFGNLKKMKDFDVYLKKTTLTTDTLSKQ